MKYLYSLILIVFIITSARSQGCADSAQIYAFTFGGKNYEIVKQKDSWSNAANCAVERGGYLVHIDSQAEQVAVFDAIINGAMISATYTVSLDGGGIAYLWIGATDGIEEGTWIWDGDNDSTGVHFWSGQGTAGDNNGMPENGNYNNWGGLALGEAAEPDNYQENQHAAGMGLESWLYGTAGEWNDVAGGNTFYYVIEYNDPTGIHIPEKSVIPVELFPNPAHGMVTIETGNAGRTLSEIVIMDEKGAVVYRKTAIDKKKMSIDLSGMNPQVYFLKIVFDNGEMVNEKLVVE